MSRDVTLQATMAELVGDETYEMWLKRNADAWALHSTGVVAVDGANHQDFLLIALVFGDNYVAQLRLKRAGRYRVGYLTSNPDTWPSESRCEFIPGALDGVGAPAINSAIWSRTSSTATKIVLSIDAASLTKDLKIFRDGIAIGTVSAAPHVNPVSFTDNNPTLAEAHVYTAKHTVGFLDGAASAPVTCFAGPVAVTDFVRTTAPDHYGSYIVTWAPDGGGVEYAIQDDFVCGAIFTNALATPTTTSGSEEVFKEITFLPPGGTMGITFHARIRKEVTAFTVTDVSDWATILIEMEVDDTNTEYNSCP